MERHIEATCLDYAQLKTAKGEPQCGMSQDFIARAALCTTPIGHSCCAHWDLTNTALCHLLVAVQVCL